METNKLQWKRIAKGDRLPCDSFLMKYDGTIPPVISSAGAVIGQDAFYLPAEELRTLPKEESEDEKIRKEIINYFEHHPNIIVKRERKSDWIAWLEKQSKDSPILSNSSKNS